VIGIIVYALFLVASRYDGSDMDVDSDCVIHERLMAIAILLSVGGFFISFFGFLPCFKFLLHSPGIRQMHQATRYYHSAARPPNLIYVTDGGVQDCTGILQLIRRRSPRILLVLAAADPADELGVLRTTMNDAAKEKLASFYDPTEPRRDVLAALDDFQHNKDATYLHLLGHPIWLGHGGRVEPTHSEHRSHHHH